MLGPMLVLRAKAYLRKAMQVLERQAKINRYQDDFYLCFEQEIHIWLKVPCEFLCFSMKIHVQLPKLVKCPKVIDSL